MTADSQTNETCAPSDLSADIADILDTVDLPIIIIGGDCRVARFNRSAAAVLFLEPAHIGRDPGDVFQRIKNLGELCALAIAGGAPHRFEARDGDRCFLIRIASYKASDARTIGAVLTFTNVTAFRASLDQAIYDREYTKAILNTVIEPLVVLDSALCIQTANRAFYTMFGFSRDETQGVPFYSLGDSAWKLSGFWETLPGALSENREFQPVEVEREFPAVGRRTVRIEARRLSRFGRAMILLGLHDITERKRSQEAILQRTAQFQTLLNEAPLGVYLIGGDFRIREVNPAALRIFRNIFDPVGRDFNDVLNVLWPGEYAEELAGRLRHTLETGEPYFVAEQAGERRDGEVSEYYEWQVSRIPLPEGGYGAVCYFREISGLVQARHELEKSERQLRNLAETIPQLVWTCLPDGNADYLSAQWVKYTGIPETEQLGMQWLELVMHPEDRERAYDAWMAAVEDREPYDIEYRLKRFDGVYRWFRTRGAAVRNPEGAIEKWFGTCTDIEDQKAAERRMLEQQKRESLGMLAGGIAHDFNNLLVGVLGNASMIDETLGEKHPVQPLVHGIVEAGERAAHLTRQMLAYAGKGRIVMEQVDVNALVRSTALLVETSFPKSVHLTLSLEETPLTVEADSSQIQQVIMNLAINGAEAIEPDNSGSVRIRTAFVRFDTRYLKEHNFVADTPSEGMYVCIEVQDTGSGIEPAKLTKIFDPFFTTKFTGRGLGLAAVLGIVRSAHGGLEVVSNAGHGTTFRVLLPAFQGAAPIESAAKEQSAKTAPGRPVVLVIDDEKLVRQTTRAMLSHAGYDVLLAESGAQGLEIFSAPPAEIALVILDMSMPGMSGKDTLARLRKSDDRVPVMIVSGFSEEQVFRHFEGMKISGFLQKPFTSHRIASAVHALLSPVPSCPPESVREDVTGPVPR